MTRKMVRHNGNVYEIVGADLSDEEVAHRFRMLTPGDLSAEALISGKPPLEYWCVLIRDRILHLSQRIATLLVDHDKRVTELLEANNREVERRRSLENLVADLSCDLTDEGASYSVTGLHKMRVRVADALPLAKCPDWLTPYRRLDPEAPTPVTARTP